MINPASNEIIRLSFPVNAAYVSSARLTSSSVANRLRFDIDEIEDIKSAVSEACAYIIKAMAASVAGNFEISFMPRKDEMHVVISAKGRWAKPEASDSNEMSLMMISALVDEFDIDTAQPDCLTITMLKKHRVTVFERSI